LECTNLSQSFSIRPPQKSINHWIDAGVDGRQQQHNEYTVRIRAYAKVEIAENDESLTRRPTKRHDKCHDNAEATDSTVDSQMLTGLLLFFTALTISFRYLQQPEIREEAQLSQ
jgi:hypothetical protein